MSVVIQYSHTLPSDVFTWPTWVVCDLLLHGKVIYVHAWLGTLTSMILTKSLHGWVHFITFVLC